MIELRWLCSITSHGQFRVPKKTLQFRQQILLVKGGFAWSDWQDVPEIYENKSPNGATGSNKELYTES